MSWLRATLDGSARVATRLDEVVGRGPGRRWLDPLLQISRQLGGVLLLREASDALEVEDYPAAEERFTRVLAIDATRETRLMAYHGAVVARLRLGRYEDALRLADDALLLLSSCGSGASRGEDDRALREGLSQAQEVARWALAHPETAAQMRRRQGLEAQRERLSRQASEPTLLGRAEMWPQGVRIAYHLVVQGLLGAGLLAMAGERFSPARRLLQAALLVSRYDIKGQRDVCWHLCQVDEALGLSQEAESHRAMYEKLNRRVRRSLQRLRWTN